MPMLWQSFYSALMANSKLDYWTTWSPIPINHKKCNFQENKNSQVMKERENLHDILRESPFNMTREDEDIEGGL